MIIEPGTIRGAYSKLNPQFKEIVDYYCSLDEIVSRLSVPSFLQSASRGAQFFNAVSSNYPECISFRAWLPYIRVARKNIQYLTDEEVSAPLSTIVGNTLFDYLTKEHSSDSSRLFITKQGKEFKADDVICCVKKIFRAAKIRQSKGNRQ